MIIAIESSLSTFKSVRFHAGLNILLADRRPDSSDKQTRNSAGKTSLIEIIHFLLGANCDKDSLFRTAALVLHTFTGTFLIKGEEFKVQRGGNDPSKMFILAGSTDRLDLPTKLDKASERPFASVTNWKAFLGHAMFGLPFITQGTAFDAPDSPSFRSLFSYFARREVSKAFSHAERQGEKQQRSDWQVNLSYILGLDWELARDFQRVRDRERTLEELRKAAKQGALSHVVGTVAELRPQVAIATTKAEKLRTQLKGFEVLDSYRDLSKRAAKAKTEMQELSRESTGLQETLQHLEQALADERAPGRNDLQKLYAATGVELPGVALRRFAEVEAFHESVIRNRRAHLQQEIVETKGRLSSIDGQMAKLDAERRHLMGSLQGKGALDDFINMQHELAEQETLAAVLRARYQAAEVIEGESTQLEVDRANLKKRLQEDHHGRAAALDKAILLVADIIGELYDDRAGRLVVKATDNGPEFGISIEGDRGGGISSVEVFCMDLALFILTQERFGGPGFLAHDSHLFDGVDARQIAQAFLLGARAAGTKNQYIVTMNSDIFDALPLPAEIDRAKVVLRTRLSDETETGGLFGFRFD